MTKNQLDSSSLQEQWYYRVQLAKDQYTNGPMRNTLGLIRSTLRHIELEDTSVLDIGTQEAVVPILCHRQGAKNIHAYDRLDLSSRIDLLKAIYDVDFTYHAGQSISHLTKEIGTFDIVNFSGVLYHMLDPLAGLIQVRNCVRTGGLLIIETSIYNSADFDLKFNTSGRFYKGSNYFQVTLGLLEYWLQMVGLRSIDCLFVRNVQTSMGRILVVCRAEEKPIIAEDDHWLTKPFVVRDMQDVGLSFQKPLAGFSPISYKIQDANNLVVNPVLECLDLFRTFNEMNSFANSRRFGELNLNDQE